MSQAAEGAWLIFCLGVVLFVPGAAALALVRHPARGAERLAMAGGLSVTLWPVVILWSTLAGWRWSAASYWPMLLVLALAGFMSRGPSASKTSSMTGVPPAFLPRRASFHAIALSLVVAMAVVTRIVQIQGLLVPPWVDGLHHTVVAQIMAETGRLPDNLRPFVPVDRFYYHFGFHALAAAVKWLSGAPITTVVLWLGQALNAATMLGTYLLVKRLLGRTAPAIAASIVPAALYWFPAYFVTWGRYTQLCGLVALPVVWCLVHEACRAWQPRESDGTGSDGGASVTASQTRSELAHHSGTTTPRRRGLFFLAAFSTAGLLLVHYRVFLFFLLGILILVLHYLRMGRSAQRRLARLTLPPASSLVPKASSLLPSVRWILPLVGIGILGAALVAPWVMGNLYGGVRAMAAGSDQWFVGPQPADVNAMPDWLFSTHDNGLWLRVGSLGVLAGLLRRRRPAFALLAYLALAAVAVNPRWLALPESWLLPRFTLAISAFLPIALGCGLLLESVWALLRAGRHRWGLQGRRGEGARIRRAMVHAPTALMALCLVVGVNGAWNMRTIVNQETILVRPADLEAAAWIRGHTAPDAKFLVSTAAWQLGAYRGLDGGYWLPVLAARATNIPPALYVYGSVADVTEIGKTAEIASKGDGLSDEDLTQLMDRVGAGYVYVGPASASNASKLSAARLARHPALRSVYQADGAWVFERIASAARLSERSAKLSESLARLSESVMPVWKRKTRPIP